MSWLSGIAGKAEDLLNRVDQTAAVALQTSNENTKQKKSAAFSSPWTSSTYSGVNFNPVSPVRASTLDSLNQKHSPKNIPRQAILKNKMDSDEDLINFLNSKETVAGSSSKVPSSEKSMQVEGKESKEEIKQITPSASFEFLNLQDEISSEQFSDNVPVSKQEQEEIESDVINILPESLSTIEGESLFHTSSQHIDVIEGEISDHDSGTPNKTAQGVRFEKENKLLRKEITSLNQEINSSNERFKESEKEMKRMQKRLDHWNFQISGSDHLIRELKAREADLITALSAKDSQLAVLRVRLQEADQELESKRMLIENFQKENDKILKEHTEDSSFQKQSLEILREKLQETENSLRREQEVYQTSQVDQMQRINKLEEEKQHLMENVTLMQKKYEEEKAKNKNSTSQLKITKSSLESLKQEFSDYKQKAQRILQSKEKLISSLKDTQDPEKCSGNVVSNSVLEAELEELKQERDIMKEELHQATITVESLHSEIQDIEQMSQNELTAYRDQQKNLEDQIKREIKWKNELEQEYNQQKDELKFLHEDTNRQKSHLQSRIDDRDNEIEKLRRQLTAKALSSATQEELEVRLSTLTENLIQKQTLVETLSTEKNSLSLQLERLEQQVKEVQYQNNPRRQTAVLTMGTDTEEKFKSFSSTLYDGTVTRKMKRVYGTIDSFSVRMGVFLRRNPTARLFVIVYMFLLHLWVMIVLLTYQPEIHGPHIPPNGTSE